MQCFPAYGLLELTRVARHVVGGSRRCAVGILIAAVLITPSTVAMVADDLREHIDRLGDRNWNQRHRATEALLEAGHAAVPALRAQLESGDPEVQDRIRWLLSVLDPSVFDVVVLRLGPLSNAKEETEAGQVHIREWISLAVVERRTTSGLTRDLDGEGTRVTVGAEAMEPQVRLLVRRAEENLAGGIPRTMELDQACPLASEIVIEEEQVKGRVDRTVRSSMWVLWLRGRAESHDPQRAFSLGSEALEATLSEALAAQQRHDDEAVRAWAHRIIAHWGRPELLAEGARVEAFERGNWLSARLLAGDESARDPLEAWLDSPAFVSASPAVRDGAAIALVKGGSARGLGLLLSRLSELRLWDQYRAMATLNHLLASPTLAGAAALEILEAISDPAIFTYLPWRSSETALLWQRLQERIPPETFAEHLFPLLEDGLAANSQSLPDTQNALLRALTRLRETHPPAAAKWLKPVLGFLNSRDFDAAFGLIREEYLSGRLTPAEWDQTLEGIRSCLSEKGAGNNFRASEMVRVFARTESLSLEDVRKLWIARIHCFLVPESYTRERVDRELDQIVGKLEENAPKRDDDQGWKERLGQRQRQIEEATEATLRPPPPEDFPRFRLTEVDFRIDRDRRAVTCLDFRQARVQVGVASPATGPDGGDRSILLTPQGSRPRQTPTTTHFLLGTSTRLVVGQPILSAPRSRYRFTSYMLSDVGYGRQALRNRRTVQYRTLLFLEEEETAIAAASWRDLAQYTVAEAAGDNHRNRHHWMNLVRELRLREALPLLRELFEETQDSTIARTLLALGDASGVHVLREGIDQGRRPPIPVVEELIKFGDAPTIAQAIDWIKTPPKKWKPYTYQLIDALQSTLHGEPAATVDEEELIEALMAALAENRSLHQVITLLRRRTGLDFGYYETLQVRDPRERTKAQQAVIERWQKWRETADRTSSAK